MYISIYIYIIHINVWNKLDHHCTKSEIRLGESWLQIHPLFGSEVCCAVCSSEVLGKPGIVSCSDSALPCFFFLWGFVLGRLEKQFWNLAGCVWNLGTLASSKIHCLLPKWYKWVGEFEGSMIHQFRMNDVADPGCVLRNCCKMRRLTSSTTLGLQNEPRI